jgi:hypothetical protein
MRRRSKPPLSAASDLACRGWMASAVTPAPLCLKLHASTARHGTLLAHLCVAGTRGDDPDQDRTAVTVG